MPHKLEKFYNAFKSLDTRSNKLIQESEIARAGSKNFRFNFQDELQKANGFQHKSDTFNSVGLAEYRYKDLNTGQSKSEILSVGTDGFLYKKLFHALKVTSLSQTTFTYSFYYDETLLTYVFKSGTTTISVSDTMTMDALKTALNTAFPAYTFTVVDSLGTTVTSTKLAYYGNVVIDKTVDCANITGTFLYKNFNFHESFYFEKVVTPANEELFPTTFSFRSDDTYEGISSVNANNSLYLTDGGFPIKYDGYAAYRMGMPRTQGNENGGASSTDGFALSPGSVAPGGLDINAVYKYYFQYGFVDANGVEILGKTVNPLTATTTGANAVMTLTISPIKNTNLFPVFSCKATANKLITLSDFTFSVASGHNIQVGMVLRVPVSNAGFGLPGISFWYPEVTGTTATSITIDVSNYTSLNFLSPENPSFTFLNNQWISAGYASDNIKGTATQPALNGGSYFQPQVLAGAFVRVYRSTGGTDVISRLIDLPVPIVSQYSYVDSIADTSLSSIAYSVDDGQELPRACKYLSKYQDTIFQAGRPVNANLANVIYPTVYASVVNSWGVPYTEGSDPRIYYTEASLCDFSSVYWADIDDLEGFPQDGLHEFLIDTPQNDQIKGIAPNKDVLVVFKGVTTSILSGDVANNVLQYEVLEQVLGCASHKSIQEVEGALIWCDKDYGFYTMVAGRLPIHIGFPISDYFRQKKVNAAKAVSCNYIKESLYICAVEGKTFVYDYAHTSQSNTYRNCWYLWDRFSPVDMVADADSNVYLVDSRMWKMKTTNTKYDFSDHKTGISFVFNTAWINFGFPTIDKTFFGLWINSIQGGFTLDVTQYANYLDVLTSKYEGLSFPVESAKKTVKNYVNGSLPKVSSLSWGMENSVVNAFVRIHGWEVEFDPAYDTNEPRQ